jgi:hypothetical protein
VVPDLVSSKRSKFFRAGSVSGIHLCVIGCTILGQKAIQSSGWWIFFIYCSMVNLAFLVHFSKENHFYGKKFWRCLAG